MEQNAWLFLITICAYCLAKFDADFSPRDSRHIGEPQQVQLALQPVEMTNAGNVREVASEI